MTDNLSKIVFSKLAEEWHPTKNIVDLNSLTAQSNKVVWWLCDKGHEWQSAVNLRTKGYGACKKCKSLSVISPELAKTLHPTKNGSITGYDVLPGSTKKVWWLGECGHEWIAAIRNRYRDKQSCPYCSNQKILAGFNDLETTEPELLQYWDKNKNLIKPTEITSGNSKKKIWWKLPCNHNVYKTINHFKKIANKDYCVECNSVVTDKTLLLQWNYAKNSISPSEIALSSEKKVWWVGVCGHEWLRACINAYTNNNCPICNNHQILVGYNDLATTNKTLSKEWNFSKNRNMPEDFTKGSSKKVWWLCDKGHEWQATISDRNRGSRCPNCFHSSEGEGELKEFLRKFNNIEENVRTIIPPYELDIYIPENNIAIEYNGLYWHSEKSGKDKWYHYNKWLACKEKGIQLITIWEDDWKNKEELIKMMIKHKLNKSDESKIFARQTKIVEPTKQETDKFLQINHIQGSIDGSIRIGLKDDKTNELVAVMLFKKRDNETIELTRYATSKIVPGGFTKLLKHFEKNSSNFKKIVTFADHSVSNGLLYENNGFIVDKNLPPDYSYVKNNKRIHKFNYRLKRFLNDPNLIYQSGLTEKELATLNNLYRIWDCGKTRYIKMLDEQ